MSESVPTEQGTVTPSEATISRPSSSLISRSLSKDRRSHRISARDFSVPHLSLPMINDPRSQLWPRNHQMPLTEKALEAASVEEEQKRRKQLTQKVATDLMMSALNRRPDLFPVFVSDNESGQQSVLQGDKRTAEMPKRLLMAPCLGLAAGANAIGGFSLKYPISKTESERIIQQERDSNEVLFSMWEARNAKRQECNDRASLEEELHVPLWCNFRRSLTEEEAAILRETEQLQGVYAEKRKRHDAMTSAPGFSFVSGAKGSQNAPWGYNVCGRGIAFPLHLYEKLFKRVLAGMHKHLVTLLKGKVNEETYGISMSMSSDPNNSKSVALLLSAELELATFSDPSGAKRTSGGGGGCTTEDSVGACPPLASVPQELCCNSMIVAEAALSVTILWRILDQAKNLSPGITWALHLYTKYILPHVYENFALYESHLPSSGAISEQVDQLSTLRLNLLQYRHMNALATQAKGDMQYMEEAMKRWAWRTWRQSMLQKKRREMGLRILYKVFGRLHVAKQLQKCFSQWRVITKESSFSAGLDLAEQRYRTFLGEAKHAAREVQLFTSEKGSPPPPSVTLDQNKFIAAKLAETATHSRTRSRDATSGKKDRWSSDKSATTAGGQEDQYGSSCKRMLSLETDKLTPVCKDGKTIGDSDVTPGSRVMLRTPTTCGKKSRDSRTVVCGRVTAVFETMLQKLSDMEAISGHLRESIAVQNRIIQNLERENACLKQKVGSVEESLRKSEEARLQLCNRMQERELDVQELERRNRQLKSRLRCQEQRPWQRALLRVVGDMCGASTALSELLDDSRIERQKHSSKDPSDHSSGSGNGDGSSPASTANEQEEKVSGSTGTTPRGQSPCSEREHDEYHECKQQLANAPPGAESERLFGKLAPIVLCSTRFMPDSQTILRDWANGCLDDLESLDDLRGGQLSSRFHGFSQEARSGVLLSRLLFYLALPRYQNTAAASKNPVTQRETSRRTNYVEQRRRLLARERVQLDAPFPTYADCFGDMLSLAPVSRMTILLQFAKELISSAGQVGDELVQKHLSRIYDLTLKSIEFTPSPPVSQVDLHEVVDAHALACGDKGAVLTLIALLYVRFSHPFNHKAKQSAMVEREAMLFLLSKGTYKLSQDQNTGESSAAPGEDNNSEENEPEDDGKTLARQFLTQLEDDEQSPWQLFLKHCQPLINTMAHPYILRGNFWPSTAFDSPGLAYMLGSLGLALQRSLQEHRWHIILSCLVPIRTYSGLSRGMFTGGRGSSAALQVGLDRTGDWVFPDELSCIKSALQSREEAIRTAIKEGVLKCKGGWSEEEWQKMGYFVAKDKEKLLKSFETCSFDLMQLFLRRARLSHSCAMPVIDIGNWRLLLADINIVTPDKPDASLLDMSHVTDIFFRVMSSLAETDAAVKEPDSRDENYSSMPLPHYSEEMYYPEFIAALVLLVHDMYPAVYTSEDDKDKEPTITWIGDALTDFNFRQIVPPQTSESMVRPANAMAAIRGNAQAEEVLLRHNKVLQAIHTTYSKDVFGVVGMEKEQVVQMLRDSALTSHEISSSVVSEVFKACCVSKKVEDLCSEGKRREQDARPRDVATIRRRGNVSIVDPSVEGTSASRTKEISVLLYDGFLEFLCVICHFQLPNPLIPFDRRLERFLCRSVFRPLAHRSEAVAAVVSQHMHQLGPRAAEP